MKAIANNIPEIIREAAKSPWGVISLILLLLTIVALTFFSNSSDLVKSIAFFLTLSTFASFGVLIFTVIRKNAAAQPLKEGTETTAEDEERAPRPPVSEQTSNKPRVVTRPSWTDYPNVYQIDQYSLPYVPVMNNWRENSRSISEIEWNSVKVTLAQARFQLLDIFRETQVDSDFRDDPSCRLAGCYVEREQHLTLVLQETSYGDYLKSGEHLDDPFPTDPRETFRSALASIVGAGGGEVQPQGLTNICGTGIFLVTQDDQIIVSKHSEYSHVYPGRWTFSASGLMKWGAYPHPFMEMARKTFTEIHHQVNPDKVKLIGLGADARKLYFQFSFFEETEQPASEILERHSVSHDYINQGILRDRPRELFSLPFDLERIIDAIIGNCWETSAEACILTLCTKRFGPEKVAQALHAQRSQWTKREMRDEWDWRASRKGDLPDMSVRYPPDRLIPTGAKLTYKRTLQIVQQRIVCGLIE